MALPTNWTNNIGMQVDADFLNDLGTAVNAAAPLYGTYASRPTASADNAGAHYYCSDTDSVYRSTGTDWVKIRVSGSAGPTLADPPTTGWTAVNMLSGWTWAADKDSMLLTCPSVGANDNIGYQYRAYPGTPFTLTACIEPTLSKTGTVAPAGTSLGMGGIVISDGTKIIIFGPAFANISGFGSVGAYALGLKFNSATVYANSAPCVAESRIIGGLPKWYRVVDNGTNLSLQYSHNGVDWEVAVTESRTTFLTPSRLGFGADNYSGATVISRLRSWTVA